MSKLYIIMILVTLLSGLKTAAQSMPQDSLISAAMQMISEDSLSNDIQSLQDMGTRFLIAGNRKEVATWIMDKYLSFGIQEVRLDSFECYTHINAYGMVYDTTTWQYNVEARIEGMEVPDEEVVLIGHYDDFSQDGDPEVHAPGADDNASGTSAAIEVARVITEMGYQPRQTLIFLASAAEELMYFGDSGTEHYAQEAAAAGRNIVMAINNDMVAWNDGTWTLDLFNHTGSPHITGMAIDIIQTYTNLNYNSWAPVYDVGGDIQPFLDEGYHGIYFMEHYMSPNYHTDNDLLENCDIAYLAEVTKVSLGCVMQSDLAVGTEEQSKPYADIKVYPNPSGGLFNVILPPNNGKWNVKILNAAGETLYSNLLNPGSNSLDLTGISDGIYFLQCKGDKILKTVKVVIRR